MKAIPLRELAKQEDHLAPVYAFARRGTMYRARELAIYAVTDVIRRAPAEDRFLIPLLPVGIAKWPESAAESVAFICPARLEIARNDLGRGFWLPGTVEAYAEGTRLHGLWWQLTCNSAIGYFLVLLRLEREQRERELRTQVLWQDSSQVEELRLLGLTEIPDNLATLKLAWKQQLQKAHPDRGGSLEAAQQLNAAYEKLRVLLEA